MTPGCGHPLLTRLSTCSITAHTLLPQLSLLPDAGWNLHIPPIPLIHAESVPGIPFPVSLVYQLLECPWDSQKVWEGQGILK